MRYFLLDRIDELKKFAHAVGRKAVSLSEDCFEQHFPGEPIYPGALLVEAMAQLGGALLELSLRDTMDHCPRCVMSSVTAKFREVVRPGDLLELRAEVISRHEDSAKVRVVVSCDGKRVSDAEILYMVVRLDHPLLVASRDQFLETITRGTRIVEA